MPAFFITATGTEIGKTYVTAGLIRALRQRGGTVEAFKPIVSGFDDENSADSDPAVLLEALGRPLTSAELDVVSPWRFKAPLSPDMAARKEGQRIDLEKVIAYCEAKIANAKENITLIEGIGGLMVPLNETATVLDLVARLEAPVILVSGTYLGAISHLLCALEVLKAKTLPLAAIILNETQGSSVTLHDTRETVAHFCGGVPLVTLAWQREAIASASGFDTLIEALKIT